MTDKPASPPRTPDRPAADDRDARLAKALRENLRKRKAQARERAGSGENKDRGQG